MKLFQIVLICILMAYVNASLNWLSISKQNRLVLDDAIDCRKLVGWTNVQKRFCRQYFGFMNSIRRSAILSLNECQSQFKGRRWNCSTLNQPKLFGKLPDYGLREAAYVYALSAAALTHSVTQACSEGKINGCSCDTSDKNGYTEEGYKWSGCSDNIAYGIGVAEKFLDPRIRNRSNVILVNMHNSEAGRQIIAENMQKQCKCHGVSGSCELKTCWRTMPSFKLVADKLKEKYDAATEVRVQRTQNKKRLVSRYELYDQFSKTDLVYMNRSPDYCEQNLQLASYGTHNRQCNKTSRGIDSCDLLCCGRRYHTRIETIRYKCDCKFMWCCSVQCKECTKIEEITRCS